MPESMSEKYPNLEWIIDAFEMQIQRPASLLLQSQSYSSYKSRNTVKGLVTCTRPTTRCPTHTNHVCFGLPNLFKINVDRGAITVAFKDVTRKILRGQWYGKMQNLHWDIWQNMALRIIERLSDDVLLSNLKKALFPTQLANKICRCVDAA